MWIFETIGIWDPGCKGIFSGGNGMEDPSYVISVSTGRGCYRHIQIPGNWTLFQLHQEILSAFEFDDDQPHAFFMDNKPWSERHSYYSSELDRKDMRNTDVMLSQLNLHENQHFIYFSDIYGDWFFNCRVVRILNESCPQAKIIRRAGDPPVQYDDKRLFRIPELYDERTLRDLYGVLGISRQGVRLMHTYFDAMARLYGVISLNEAFQIIQMQNQGLLSRAQFYFFCEIVRHEKQNYLLLGRGDIYKNGSVKEGLNRELVRIDLVNSDLTGYRDIVRGHMGKICCILPKHQMLAYGDPLYYEPTAPRRDMLQYLMSKDRINRKKAGTVLEKLQKFSDEKVFSLDQFSQVLKISGFVFDDEDDINEFLCLFSDLQNYSRRDFNFGWMPAELSEIMAREGKETREIVLGPGICNMMEKEDFDLEEFRRDVMKMDFPNEELRESMLGQLDEILQKKVSKKKKSSGKRQGENIISFS